MDDLKRKVARAALDFVVPGQVLGVGTGSTANHFIELVGSRLAGQIPGAVASSEASARELERWGIPVVSLNTVTELAVYVDGADEFDGHLCLLKGGGGALTREKIVAQAARTFVCIVDESKRVDRLGNFPLPVEVIPMARELVARELRRLGGDPHRRADVITDNGNEILDVNGLDIDDPPALEAHLDAYPGVVASGLFARRRADIVLMGTPSGVEQLGEATRSPQ